MIDRKIKNSDVKLKFCEILGPKYSVTILKIVKFDNKNKYLSNSVVSVYFEKSFIFFEFLRFVNISLSQESKIIGVHSKFFTR
jgi:hypothetical protein